MINTRFVIAILNKTRINFYEECKNTVIWDYQPYYLLKTIVTYVKIVDSA